MKYLMALLFTLNANAVELDLSYSQVNHAWRGPDNIANYAPKMVAFGITYPVDNFAFRLGYGRLNNGETTGKYSDLVLEMDYILAYEVMYLYKFNGLMFYVGIGHYQIPASVRAKSTDYYDHDYDNDEGFFVGVNYPINEKFSVGYKFTRQSRIKVSPYDEWTQSHGLHFIYKF